MAITFACPTCDRTYTVDDQFAGRVAPCTDCRTRMVVPQGETQVVPQAETPAETPVVPQRETPSRREASEVEGVAPRGRNAAAADAARYLEEAAKKQRRRRRKAEARKAEPRVGISFSPTIIAIFGGAGLMALAVGWCAVSLLVFNSLNIRGPAVMLIAGFIGLLKGLLGHED